MLKQVEKDSVQIPLLSERGFIDPSEKLEFYQHDMGWSNRFILGDSLKVMASLLEHEKMGSKVQCIYMDPPFGINFNSNFQTNVRNLDISHDKDEGIPREPGMIKAFRDTWTLGTHSYLTYLRDRLAFCRELLDDTGSLFLQMGDENFGRAMMLLDEIFGANNRVTVINQRTSGGTPSKFLPEAAQYIIWYARNKSQLKYNQLYEVIETDEQFIEFANSYCGVDIPGEKSRYLTSAEKNDIHAFRKKYREARLWKAIGLTSQGKSVTEKGEKFSWDGREFLPSINRQWSVTREGLKRLGELNRLFFAETKGSNLSFKRYEDEVPGKKINNFWDLMTYPNDKRYVVQTAEKIIARCILMTTSPGDLVLDPTCGSGTTAKVCENWGRKWITIDSSRVAIQIARERLIGASMDWYELKNGGNDPSTGIKVKTIKTVSAATLAYGTPPNEIQLVDQPLKIGGKNKIIRVSGPFTIEGLSLPTRDPYADTPNLKTNDEIAKQVVLALQDQGIPTTENGNFEVLDIDLFHNSQIIKGSGTCIFQSESEMDINSNNKVSFGVIVGDPYAPITMRTVDAAVKESRLLNFDLLVFTGFEFDPYVSAELSSGIYTYADKNCFVTMLQLDNDILLEDLLRKPLGGFPLKPYASAQIRIERLANKESSELSIDQGEDEKWKVEVLGFMNFDPSNGRLQNFSQDEIRCWMLDTNYNGEVFFATQVFFPGLNQKNRGWKEIARTLQGTINETALDSYDSWESIPFTTGEFSRIAVRVISTDGSISERIKPLEAEDDEDVLDKE